MKVVLSRRANNDLLDQIEWLSALSPGAARAAGAAITSGLRTLGQFPMAGRAVGDEREWPIRFGRHGFVVVYRVEPDRVVVGRVFHARQDRG